MNTDKRRLNKAVVREDLKKRLQGHMLFLSIFGIGGGACLAFMIFICLQCSYVLAIFFGVIALPFAVVLGTELYLWVKTYLTLKKGRFHIEKDTFSHCIRAGTSRVHYKISVGSFLNFPRFEGEYSHPESYYFERCGKVDTYFADSRYLTKGMEVYLVVLDATGEVVSPFYDARFYELNEEIPKGVEG